MRLHADPGDTVYLTEAPGGGYRVTPYGSQLRAPDDRRARRYEAPPQRLARAGQAVIVFVEATAVYAFHDAQIAEHGGSDGLRGEKVPWRARSDAPSINTATATLRRSRGPSRGLYAFGIAKGHAFVDGNKRTAAVVMETFIELNGSILTATDAEIVTTIGELSPGRSRRPPSQHGSGRKSRRRPNAAADRRGGCHPPTTTWQRRARCRREDMANQSR